MKTTSLLLFAIFLSSGVLTAIGQTAGKETEAVEEKKSPSIVLVEKARAQVGVTTRYDGSYVAIPYPMGDIPIETGVCTDVVIRAMRGLGIDLQQKVHEDMKSHFKAYPQQWGLKSTDRNIDHRRVPNLMKFFERQGWKKPVTQEAKDYLPGDIVTWMLPGNLPHIGIVSDKKSEEGVPLIIHNIGMGADEEDSLFLFKITGHYRPAYPKNNP